jgi:hypothetical protein
LFSPRLDGRSDPLSFSSLPRTLVKEGNLSGKVIRMKSV